MKKLSNYFIYVVIIAFGCTQKEPIKAAKDLCDCLKKDPSRLGIEKCDSLLESKYEFYRIWNENRYAFSELDERPHFRSGFRQMFYDSLEKSLEKKGIYPADVKRINDKYIVFWHYYQDSCHVNFPQFYDRTSK